MTNKVLITGANKGIGFETARQLGELGWSILLGARNEERGLAAVAELQQAGITAEWIELDLNAVATIQQAADYIKTNHADLNVLINNAGIPGDMQKSPLDFTTAELREVVDVNFFGNFEMIKAFTPILQANNGRILNLSIPTVASPYFHPFAYMTSKAPLNAMIQAFGMEYTQRNIAVEIFGVMPGGVTTDLNGNAEGSFMKTLPEGGKVIVDLLTDGKHRQGQVVNEYGVAMDYEANYLLKEEM
ncbi:SDR family NAD(P)-dependent oxidoreductase [Periweissella cryptocerci]|uniref:SDR family NAD(P)-dependent oxidoreductase n=1 Tax=Periweissella cryptocerci TaxID=2506420 RepID=A0A4V1AIE5_9LACO|nr:SDR family NAD(P)-dependent oxidoreductase [Periweissella cryptocerci]QBO35225.1 SDR family NAD(P)-dependent oxidoreductase [Periweissella cryptocerci]